MSDKPTYINPVSGVEEAPPEGTYYSEKDEAWHTLPSVEYYSDLSPENRREALTKLLDEFKVTAEEREAIFEKYGC